MNKKHFYATVILLSFLVIGIQPALAAILVPSEVVDRNNVVVAERNGNTYKLIRDIDETLIIQESEIVLDGNGHTITGPGPNNLGMGVDINGNFNFQNGITVKDLTITGFQIGIWINNSNPGPATPKTNTLENNTIFGCTTAGIRLTGANETNLQYNNIYNNTNSAGTSWGILISTSGNTNNEQFGNTLFRNTVTNNNGGIQLNSGSSFNTLEENTVTGSTATGIFIDSQSNNNTLTGNTSSSNRDGIFLRNANYNSITGNIASNNQNGIKLLDSSNNTLTNNTVSGNTVSGIFLDPSVNNQINNNNFINNTPQAYVADDSINNNLDGNHWSDWVEGSGPYVILSTPSSIQVKDLSPFADPNGWIVDTTPPEISCPGDVTIEAMGPDGVPIDDERIQTFLAGASATDNCDPPEDIIITNNAPALFPSGDTVVTFTATDTSDNSSTCQSTVTVVEAAESSLRIIPRIINREGRLTKILAVIRFPVGTTTEDIDIGQSIIMYPGDSPDGIAAINQRIVTWCRWGTLRVSVFASFSKDEVTALIPEDGPAELMVIGRFTDGQYFYGFDNVWICSWSW